MHDASYEKLVEENGRLQADKRRMAERIRLLEIEIGTLREKVRNLEHIKAYS